MTDQEITRSVRYGTHASAMEEMDFSRAELSKQAWAGHTALSPLWEILHLHRLWISPLTSIPHQGRKLRLIYDFSWSGLNKEVTQVVHKEAMRFRKSLYHLIDYIIAAPP